MHARMQIFNYLQLRRSEAILSATTLVVTINMA